MAEVENSLITSQNIEPSQEDEATQSENVSDIEGVPTDLSLEARLEKADQLLAA